MPWLQAYGAAWLSEVSRALDRILIGINIRQQANISRFGLYL
tara:strand:+ start:1046 stop:1171 length:126 start_codon:yes stop_codon:yes gene_type:complete